MTWWFGKRQLMHKVVTAYIYRYVGKLTVQHLVSELVLYISFVTHVCLGMHVVRYLTGSVLCTFIQ